MTTIISGMFSSSQTETLSPKIQLSIPVPILALDNHLSSVSTELISVVPPISGITQHLSLCDWLASLIFMSPRLVHTGTGVRTSLLVKAEWYCTVWRDLILCIRSFLRGHLGGFHALVLGTNAAVNTGVQSTQDPAFSSSRRIPRSAAAGSRGDSTLNFLRNCRIVFHSSRTTLHSHPSKAWRFQFLYSLTSKHYFLSLSLFLITATLIGVMWCPTAVVNCISLMMRNVKHLCMCSWPLHILEKCPVKSFARVLIVLFRCCCWLVTILNNSLGGIKKPKMS